MQEYDDEPLNNQEIEQRTTTNNISIKQLQYLVYLLDHSDVSELELKRPEEGTRLVLRKVRAPEPAGQQSGVTPITPAQVTEASAGGPSAISAAPRETKHPVVAHLVGIFHTGLKPKGGALVAIGDRVKAGQLVATIESLNVINEVETPVAGRVVELLVQEGQPVEYGQPLMVIDSAGEEKRD